MPSNLFVRISVDTADLSRVKSSPTTAIMGFAVLRTSPRRAAEAGGWYFSEASQDSKFRPDDARVSGESAAELGTTSVGYQSTPRYERVRHRAGVSDIAACRHSRRVVSIVDLLIAIFLMAKLGTVEGESSGCPPLVDSRKPSRPTLNSCDGEVIVDHGFNNSSLSPFAHKQGRGDLDYTN